MFNNVYENIKKFIKRNYKCLIFYIVLCIVFLCPLNYYIIVGGGISEVGNRIEVENSYKSKGSFSLAYVSEIKGTIATYLLSYVMPDWKRVKMSDYTYYDEEDKKDIEFRGKIDLLNSNDFAIKNAYLSAGKSYVVSDTNLYVYLVDKDSKNKFKVGDKILEVDGVKINSVDDYKEIIEKHNVFDVLDVMVERNKKEKIIKTTIYSSEDDNRKITGIYINSINIYKTNPKVNIKFKSSESGASGGLIETLDIYNKLVKEDITKGKKIAGTGEIDSDGNILSIGEVKYKLLGAVKKKADIFIVPNGENYKTCMKVKKEKKLKIKIIGVSTFREALEKLK